MTPSIQLQPTPDVQYLLRLGDTCLILGQRLGEWCGHAPVLEEDIALANMALDLIGQTRALLTRAGQLDGQGLDEDQLAFLRDERGHYDFGAIDWDEFWQVVGGDGPMNRERLAARVKAWDDGEWVRDAAMAHAAKQSMKEAA